MSIPVGIKSSHLSFTLFILYVSLVCIYACGSKASNTTEEPESEVSMQLSTQLPEVAYTPAISQPFMLQDIVNGKINAYNTITIKPEVGGYLQYFPWRNGHSVAKDQDILRIDDTQWRLDLEKLQIDLKQAQLDRDERILLIGGEFGQDSSISTQKLNYVTIKSGLEQIQQQIKTTKWQIGRAVVKAPFDGQFADIKIAPFQLINAGEAIATLIDPNSLEVSCLVLETLATRLRKGQSLQFKPVNSSTLYQGQIHVINPVVDKNGLVEIRARIANHRLLFFHGMNVRVYIEQPTEPRIVIPKEALVLRSNREVVFTYDTATGRAKWNYVTVAHENEELLAISEGLKPGDLIIYKGHLNLDHDARVKISDVNPDEANKLNQL